MDDLFPARVLVTEDNPHSQRVLAHMLNDLGIRSDVATSGEQAVEMLRRSDYDLVLMDTHLPGMDGIEATRTIRGREGALHRTRIVAMTTGIEPDEHDRLVDSGTDDVLSKPVRFRDLAGAIHKWIGSADDLLVAAGPVR